MTDLDLSPLGRRAGVLARLRAIGSSPRLVIGATIGVLVLLGPSIGILVAVLGTETDRGFVGTMALFGACGVWVLIDVLRKAGTGAGLESLARANHLDLFRSLAARGYAGSRFRSGERIILHSLRTRTAPALEVGDTWPVERIRYRVRTSGSLTTVGAANAPRAEGFLRVAVPDRSVPPQEDATPFPMTAQLDAALADLLGPYSLEVHDGEITVMGSQPLDPEKPERITAAFALAAALAQKAGLSPSTDADAGAPAPERARGSRPRHPLAIAAAVLALLIVLPVGFAVVMSMLEDLALGEVGARMALILFLIVASLCVMLLIRWATAGRRRPRDQDRNTRSRQEGRRSDEEALR